MSRNWELELLDAASEYIPGYGEIYSFRRAKHAAEVGDMESEFKFISTLGIGVVRDALLLGGYLEALPATVLFAASENIAKKISDVYWGKSTQKIRIPLPAKQDEKRQAAGEKGRHRILIPYEEGKTEAEKKKFLENQTQVAATVYFRHSVFHGRLNYDKEPHGKAVNENFFLIVPDGFRNDAPCQIMTTLTEDGNPAKESKRPLIYVSTKMIMDISKGEFEVIPPRTDTIKSYSWFGVIATPDKTKPEDTSICLQMKDVATTIATISLDLVKDDKI